MIHAIVPFLFTRLRKKTSPQLLCFGVGLSILLVSSFGCSAPKSPADASPGAFDQLQKQLNEAQAGDTLVIPNGTWKDVVLHFAAEGTADQPVVVRAQPPGEVIFSGQSKLYLSGKHGVFEGVWFQNGHSPKGAVISFESEDGQTKASYCRVSHCSITDFSLPHRLEMDHWVEIHGNHNRFDHNYLGNKQNLGTTLVVRLNHPESQESYSKIDHNYFGPRSRMGSNGGEAMRVGSSAFSLSPAHVKVNNNYFDRCNGEVEIVSIKATENEISGNVFHACEGVLTLRHGNRNVLSNNYFLGKNLPYTGGIRVINAGHTITNNYFWGLTGHRFHAALPVMNGVPNSPINRYHQVKDATISQNTFIHCDEVAFGTGADRERTAFPQNTAFINNHIYTDRDDWKITVLDDVSGIRFQDNSINQGAAMPGFSITAMELYTTEEGLPAIKGQPAPQLPVQATATGPHWWQAALTEKPSTALPTSRLLTAAECDNIQAVVDDLNPGDTLWIAAESRLALKQPLAVKKDLFLLAKGGFPLVAPGANLKKHGLIEIHDGAQLHIQGLHFSGRSKAGDASYGITSVAPMLNHYQLHVDGCRFSDFNESRFAGVHGAKSTFADSVSVTNCWFKGFSGHGIVFSAEKEDRGRYNVEHIRVNNCVFANVMGMAIDVYRGGNDESTTGPFAWVSDCHFYNVNNKELGSVVRMLGVQYARVARCEFVQSGASGRSIFFEDPAWADVVIESCNLHESGRIQTFYEHRVNRSSITQQARTMNTAQLETWSL
ncbi:MAG: chondroitinase-B domain-containing protein [Salibacteraceae bacterium]